MTNNSLIACSVNIQCFQLTYQHHSSFGNGAYSHAELAVASTCAYTCKEGYSESTWMMA